MNYAIQQHQMALSKRQSPLSTRLDAAATLQYLTLRKRNNGLILAKNVTIPPRSYSILDSRYAAEDDGLTMHILHTLLCNS